MEINAKSELTGSVSMNSGMHLSKMEIFSSLEATTVN